jgi:uncharacterized protein DUF3224
MKASATYTVKKWEEKPYDDISSDMKMTRASVEYALDGEIKGTASVEYLMFYSHFDAQDQHKAAAEYVGLVRFNGALAGKSGSFVMQDTGKFGQGTATSTLQIVERSGTGELQGIKGTGSYRANKEGFRFEVDYTL